VRAAEYDDGVASPRAILPSRFRISRIGATRAIDELVVEALLKR